MNLATPTILITDDDRDFRETLCDVFAPRGFHTHVASDGEEAIRIVRSEQIHVVLLDMHMPKLTGLEAIRIVKEYRASLPCILMSGRMDDHLAEQAREADAFSHLSKPVSFRDLTSTVVLAMQVTYGWNGDLPK